MAQFLDLPLELLPVVLIHLPKPHHLASASLVSKTFNTFAIPQLYARASIYSWHREAKLKVIQLFDTLSRSPHLAKHVHRLEIRDFPKAIVNAEIDIIDVVLRGLRNCTNLQACTWTRDGSLNSEILKALQTSEHLKELEINGHNAGHYDPTLLSQFTNLTKISVIMPSVPVVSQLRPWLSATGNALRSLTLICKTSPIITDETLESLADSLTNLDQFHVTGCPRVTQRGVWAIISNNRRGIMSLGLEGVSLKFNMALFAERCIRSGALSHLRSITLTVHQQLLMREWMTDVLHLLSSSPLEVFHIYSTGVFFESPGTNEFWDKLIVTHGSRLTRLSVHRMLISLQAIRNICINCTSLEQLFVVVEPDSLDQLVSCLSHAKRLRVVHINYPLEAHTDALPVLHPADALKIVMHCSPTITQFGCNAKVWQVGRTIGIAEDGTMAVHRKILRYDSPDVPEAFLVVRT